MRFLIQVKTDSPIDEFSRKRLLKSGLNISKQNRITGLAEDFDQLGEFPSMFTSDIIKEITQKVISGNYSYL